LGHLPEQQPPEWTPNRTPNGHPTDTQRTGKGHPTDTYKNGEKGKKGEKVKKGEKKKDAVADSLFCSWESAHILARELEKVGTFRLRGNSGQPRATKSNRREVLRACKLAIDEVIEAAWLQEAATSTRDSKPTQNAYGYFLKLVRELCENHGVDYNAAAARVEVPQDFLQRADDRPGGREGGGDVAGGPVEDLPAPAHQACGPCVAEGLDDPKHLPQGKPAKGPLRGSGGVTG